MNRRRLLTGGTASRPPPPSSPPRPRPPHGPGAAVESRDPRRPAPGRRPLDRHALRPGRQPVGQRHLLQRAAGPAPAHPRRPVTSAYARGWAEKHAYGLHGGVTTRHADNHNAGQAYLDLYEIEPPDRRKIAAIEDSLHRMVSRTSRARTTTGGGTTPCTWRCRRSPGSARLRGDPRYWDKMHALYTHTKRVRAGPASSIRPPGCGTATSGSCPAGSSRPRAAGALVARQRLGGRRTRQDAQGPARPERHIAEYRDTLPGWSPRCPPPSAPTASGTSTSPTRSTARARRPAAPPSSPTARRTRSAPGW